LFVLKAIYVSKISAAGETIVVFLTPFRSEGNLNFRFLKGDLIFDFLAGGARCGRRREGRSFTTNKCGAYNDNARLLIIYNIDKIISV